MGFISAIFSWPTVVVFAEPLSLVKPVIVGERSPGLKYFGDQAYFLEESTKVLSLNEALSSTDWTKGQQKIPNYGASPKNLWVYFEVENQGFHKNWALNVPNPSFQVFDFHIIRGNGQLETFESGTAKPFSQRPIITRNFAKAISLENSERVGVLLKVQSVFSRLIPLEFVPEARFQADQNLSMLLFGIFTGLCLFVIFLNLVFSYVFRDKYLLVYILNILGIFFVNFTIYGLSAEFIWPQIPDYVQSSGLVSTCFYLFALGLFTVQFLGSEILGALHTRITLGISILMLGMAPWVVGVFDYVSVQVFSIVVNLCFFYFMFLGFRSVMRKADLGWFYLVGVGSVQLGAALYVLRNFGFIYHFTLGEWGPIIGATIEIFVLTTGLAYKVYRVRKDKDAALFRMLETQSELKVIQSRVDYQAQLFSLAQQLAHDIRSPISALDIVAKKSADLNGDLKTLLLQAILRIREIANGLVQRNKETRAFLASTHHRKIENTNPNFWNQETQTWPLAILINQIVQEKKMILEVDKYTKPVEFDWHFNQDSAQGICNVDGAQFRRLFSNLLNNAVESEALRISIKLKISKKNYAAITIQDNGKGIEPEVLKKIGAKGFSSGKNSLPDTGTGLGVYHARKFIEMWGGTLVFESKLLEGTLQTIELPLSKQASLFTQEISLQDFEQIVIIDDEESIHLAWVQELDSLDARYRNKILPFRSPEIFDEWIRKQDLAKRNSCCFLVDHEFTNSSQKGIELIQKWSLEKNSHLVTYRYDDPKLQSLCRQKGIKLFPKEFIGVISVQGAAQRNR